MKTAYKIFVAAAETDDSRYHYQSSNTSILKSPDFQSEQEAELWLMEEIEKAGSIPDNKANIRIYLFIKKTYIHQ